MKKIILLLIFPFAAFCQIEIKPEKTGIGLAPASIGSDSKSMSIGPNNIDFSILGNSASTTNNMGIGTGFKSSIFTGQFFNNDGKLTIIHKSSSSNDTQKDGPHLILDENSTNDFARLRFRNSYITTSTSPPPLSITTKTYNRSPRYWDIAGYSNGATESDDVLNFFSSGTKGNIMTLKGDGKVGIGQTTPQGMLHVEGSTLSHDPLLKLKSTTKFTNLNHETTLNTNKFRVTTYLGGTTSENC